MKLYKYIDLDAVKELYKGRPYHNWRHVKAMLKFCEKRESDVLDFAIMFHDAVYTPGDQLNEEKSCLLAREAMTGMTDEGRAIIDNLIMATKRHQCFDWSHPDTAWIVDADLWGFVTDPIINAGLVRQEFAHVPEEEWLRGRFRFLKAYCAREPFFYAADHEARFGNTARSNITSEIVAIDRRLREVFELPVGSR